MRLIDELLDIGKLETGDDSLDMAELELGDYTGTLWRGLVFETVKYEDAERRVEIDDLALRVNWAALAGGTLELQRIEATAVRYRELETDSAPAPSQQAEPLTLQLRILKSRIGTVTFESGDAPILPSNRD